MITLVFCLRRLPHLSFEAFHDYWLHVHGPLVRARAPLLRMARYQQMHRFGDDALAVVASVRNAPEPFDGVAQVSWYSRTDLIESATDPDGRRAARELLEDERNFIDLPNSPIFFAHVHDIVPLAAGAGDADGEA